jgi:hypothetical protein
LRGIAVEVIRSHTPDPRQSLKEAMASFHPTHVIELQATQATSRGRVALTPRRSDVRCARGASMSCRSSTRR